MIKSEAYVGQIVRVSTKTTSFIGKIEKINQKNIKVVSASGERWNAHPSFLSPATPGEVSSFSIVPPDEQIVRGSVVRFTKSSRFSSTYSYSLLVVTARKGELLDLVPLGGDEGKYFTKVASSQVERVEINVEGL